MVAICGKLLISPAPLWEEGKVVVVAEEEERVVRLLALVPRPAGLPPQHL